MKRIIRSRRPYDVITMGFFAAAYGAIYTQDGSAVQALTSGSSDKLALFNANGQGKRTVPDHTNNQITIEASGEYEISGSFSASFSLPSTFIEIHSAINGNEIDPGIHKVFATATAVENGTFRIIASLVGGDIVTVLVKPSKNGNLTIEEASLVVNRIG